MLTFFQRIKAKSLCKSKSIFAFAILASRNSSQKRYNEDDRDDFVFLNNCCVDREERCTRGHVSVEIRVMLQTCSF